MNQDYIKADPWSIIEEGFDIGTLEKIVASMDAALGECGAAIVTGDTKVVPKGAADGLFINTSGIGLIPDHVHIGSTGAQPGDRVILSGTMADHGMTILTQREGLSFDGALQSDSAPLNHMVKKMFMASRDIHVLRDPTRGGLAASLNEIAEASSVGISIDERALPVRDEVRAACEILGLDPLYVANEGVFCAVVIPISSAAVLEFMRKHPKGSRAALVGELREAHPGKVVMESPVGGTRIVTPLIGEQLPRIC